MDIDMEKLSGESKENYYTYQAKHGAEENLSYVAVPHRRDWHLDYQQEAAPRYKEAERRALRYNRAFRHALAQKRQLLSAYIK